MTIPRITRSECDCGTRSSRSTNKYSAQLRFIQDNAVFADTEELDI